MPANRVGTGGRCAFRCRSPCRHLANVASNARPYSLLASDSNTKWSSAVNGHHHWNEDDVMEEAVNRRAARDPLSSSVTAGNRFAENQCYGEIPAPLPRFHDQQIHSPPHGRAHAWLCHAFLVIIYYYYCTCLTASFQGQPGKPVPER